MAGDSIIDGTGKFMIPGMVNANVHVNKMENLKIGYYYDILTVINMHTGLEGFEHE